MLGQEIPAVPPGLVVKLPTHAYYHMLIFDHGESYPGSDTLEEPFPLALRSPFGFT